MKTKTVLRWFWAWQDEEEERWLEEMARQGWHLLRGGLVFRFERGEPREMRYRLDYRQGTGKSLREYFALLRDAGWEYVGSFAGWRYFRSPAAAEAPEIYTDRESHIQMYAQLRRLLAIVMIPNLAVLGSAATREEFSWIRIVLLATTSLLLYGIWRLSARIRALRATDAR